MTTPSVIPPVDSDNLKRCTKCGEWKPATAEYFCLCTGSSEKTTAQCRDCRAAYCRQWRKDHPTYYEDHHRAYNAEHHEQRTAYMRDYWEKHRDRLNARGREYRKEHRARDNERRRIYRATLRGKEARRISYHRRAAHKRSLPATLTPAEWQTALDAFNGCCAVCGRPPGLWHTLAADHWRPLSKGGGTTADNIVPLCHSKRWGEGSCNLSKNDNDALEWLVSRYGKRKGRAIFKRIQDWLDNKKPEN